MSVLSYTPSLVDRETLETLTAGASRLRLIESLVEAVRSEVGRETHQHHLLIGPRGSGKTHALTLVAHRLRADPELGSQVLPILLAEEEVASHPADLMRKVLARLTDLLDGMEGSGVAAARKECRSALAALHSEADDQQALEIAVGALDEAARRLGKLLVAVLENFDSLLYSGPGLSRGSAATGQWALRKLLLTTPGVLLLAAAPTLFGEVCDPRAPFYDFFRVHTLEELPPEEMVALIRTRLTIELASDRMEPTQRTRLQALAEHFEERAPRLAGIVTLTGGLPRFAHLLFDLLAETDVRQSVDVISRFLDAQTPYFQTRLDPRLVPEAELEVLDLLATADAPRTTAVIAAGLRAKSPNVVNIYLKRLRERGLVRQLGTTRKDLRYDLTEPLFRVWRRFRLGRTEREQILVLAEFVAALFERPELEEDWVALGDLEAGAFRRRVVVAALERYGWQPPALIAETGLIGELVTGDPDLERLFEEAEQESFTGSLQRADALYGQAVGRLREIGNRKALGRRLGHWSYVALLAGRPDHALAMSEEAEVLGSETGDDLSRANAIQSRGEVLFLRGDNEAALRASQDAHDLYQKVGDDLGRANAIKSRGDVLFRRGDNEAALQAFQDAHDLYQKVGDDLGRANAIQSRGEVLFLRGDNEAALQAFQDAHDLYQKVGDDLGRASAIKSRGEVLFRRGDNEAALQAFQDAHDLYQKVGSDLGRASATKSRGEVLFRRGDNEAALQAFQDAHDLYQKVGSDLGRARAIKSRGEVLFRRGDNEAVLQAFQDAHDLYQKVGDDLGVAGCHYGYGRVALSQGRWHQGIANLLTAYQTARQYGNRFNAGLARGESWQGLLRAAGRLNLAEWQGLIESAEALLRDAGEDEESRADLVRFTVGALETLGPEGFLATMPLLESRLAAAHAALLQPARLAAEILAGRRSPDLPEETAEMRRAVREVLRQIESAGRESPKRAAHSGGKRGKKRR